MRRRQRRESDKIFDLLLKFLITGMYLSMALVFLVGSFYTLLVEDGYSATGRLKAFGIEFLIAIFFVAIAILWFKVIYPGINWLLEALFDKIVVLSNKAPNYTWKERVVMIVGSLLGFGISLTLLTNNIMAFRGSGLLFDNFDTFFLLILTMISIGVGFISLLLLFEGMRPREDLTQKS